MADIPSKLLNSTRDRILEDMNPSWKLVLLKVGLSISIGGLLTLLFCGQFGIAGTSFATNFYEHLHHQNGVVCALVCGVIFSIVPIALLRLQCSYHQFQIIIKRKTHATTAWMVSLGVLLASHGDMGTEAVYVAMWIVAAILAFEVGGFLIQRIDRRLSYAAD